MTVAISLDDEGRFLEPKILHTTPKQQNKLNNYPQLKGWQAIGTGHTFARAAVGESISKHLHPGSASYRDVDDYV